MIISQSVLLRMRNVSEKFVEKIKTHTSCSITFFPNSWRWDNVEQNGTAEQARHDNIIQTKCIVCCIPMTTNTHSIYVTLFLFHSNTGYTNARQFCISTYVMYIQNVHLKLYLYFSDKLLSKRTGILETFVSRWFGNWHALLECWP